MDEAGTLAGAYAERDPGPEFEGFFGTHHADLFAALWLITRDRHEAEEIAQDAFLRLWEHWDRVSLMDDPEGYLRRSGRAITGESHLLSPDDPRAAAGSGDAPESGEPS